MRDAIIIYYWMLMPFPKSQFQSSMIIILSIKIEISPSGFFFFAPKRIDMQYI